MAPDVPAWKVRRLTELRARKAELDAATVDAFALLGYTPTERQAEFHAATEWDVLYGGAAGGGKTRALLAEGLRACIRHPGIVVLAIRESYPQLAESFIAELSRVDFAQALGAAYNKTEHNLTFANGSVIRFRYCDGLEDARIRLGSELQLLLIDEATQQDPAAIDFLSMRLRSSNPKIPVLGVRMASNPGGIGHGWAKQRYIDGTNHGQSVFEDVVDRKQTGHMVRFIPARYTDNPHVPDYEQTLDAIKDPRLRAAYRDGSWDTFAGQVFVEWSRDRHVVRPFEIPDSWIRYAGIDYGRAAPWAVLWGAVDNDRRVWVYRELYATQVGETDQAQRILAAEGSWADGKLTQTPGERVRLRLADPSMWNKTSEVNPVAMVYAAQGCVVHKATNDRLAGVQRVHSYLADGPACRHHVALGFDTCPLLHVFDTCPNLIRTLPVLPADKHNPEDVDTDAEDHAFDALRYLLMQLGVPHAQRFASPPPDTSTLQGRVAAEQARLRKPKRHVHPILGR